MDIYNGVTVIMPTYRHQAFILRAIKSLLLQTFTNWELIIINDASPDDTESVIKHHLNNPQIRYYRNSENAGLGACLNMGIKLASHNLIAYLPSDDFYYTQHLQNLIDKINAVPNCVLAYTGIKYHTYSSVTSNKTLLANGQVPGFYLQLAQVAHIKNQERWVERDELVTHDLFTMYWSKLLDKGIFAPTSKVTCEWCAHPEQRHKIINQKLGGGLCYYRSYYQVKGPIRFKLPTGTIHNEEEIYTTPAASVPLSGLKILLVGELAYNPDRILAFEEQGHKLYGLWLDKPMFSNFVGPLPFGNVTDISPANWVEEVKKIKPDIIYALLNSETVPFAYRVLTENPDIPFVWHFKEGPTFCQIAGHQNQLMALYSLSDGQIFINDEVKAWFGNYLNLNDDTTLILDGDLPKNNYFKGTRSALLSDFDGQIHTVLPGRPMGIVPDDIAVLAGQKIHVHFYGNYQDVWKDWVNDCMQAAPGYFHVHENCAPDNWVSEFSKYNAGWLHHFKSQNNGELMQTVWDDLNLPARITTLAAAGLPMLQFNNNGHIVASQALLQRYDIGVLYDSFEHAAQLLTDSALMRRLANNVWHHRDEFSFDHHVPGLIAFFNKIIAGKQSNKALHHTYANGSY
ncbi:glycosyltransferase family 2 protein [Mucilaginibacter pedocola]|uniref:Glycosyltransferase 2-like domain-containing protein n=1 Tax=Mucilaginibacter pedocola TaxID=1792845 RepID=A0A1S9P733_9SPHI|nr:glycosyltransferase family 2 protein [Mucilaginibacter pedocola]OOQ56754.1 hypothetical protein BC343_17340 [Mucilaginibacter pedocola]